MRASNSAYASTPSATASQSAAASAQAKANCTATNHQSVQEQSGLYAGEEGFAIHIGGRTSLKGGAIASSREAAEQGRNRC